jgi:hypothetical protein
VFVDRVLRNICGHKGDWEEGGENGITKSFVICTLCQVKLDLSGRGGWWGLGK